MTKRLYQLLFFFAFFSFQLSHSFAQSLALGLGSDAREVKAIDTSLTTTPTFRNATLRAEATSVSAVIIDAACYGSHDGKITYTISGGTPPYTYHWSSGESDTVYGSCWNIISITNPGSTALTDYQVLVTLPYYTGMNADFSDVLFSDTNSTVSYSYWRESFQSATTADFWIKMPTFPPGISYVRVSYCDASASSHSDGPSTFEYFDGFDDADFSDWNHVCADVDYPDELCDATISTVSGSDYDVKLHSYAHCVGAPVAGGGVQNTLQKNVLMPPGQYWLDISSQFYICLRTICPDSARLYSRLYIDGAFFSAYFLEKNTTCSCVISPWTQIRANGPTTYSGLSKQFDLRTEVTDCGEGELQYDNFRLRKWYVDPVVTIDVPKQLFLDSLLAGDYTITITDGAGTTTVQTFTVHQPNPPAVSDNSICNKTPSVLTTSGAYTSFHWYALPSGGTALQTGSTFTTDSLTKDSTFYVTGTGSNGCETTPRTPTKTTIVLPSKSNGCLTIYSGISPNGDGLNDDWEIKGIEGYPDNHVTIFDRWGVTVFKKDSYDNRKENTWKGTGNQGFQKDHELPNGTYYYEIEINGLTTPLSGFIVINRKH
ncbi:MAG: hypothetical protein JWO58_1009 [Chitinophagaceae bacterium]|nr:hypothetical protein [Chitinophagaceae bacterium]